MGEAKKEEQARQELQEAIASLLKGQGVPQAAELLRTPEMIAFAMQC